MARLTWNLARLRRPPTLDWYSVFRQARRRCREQGIGLRRCPRKMKKHARLGDFYAVNLTTGAIGATHVRLEHVAVALDVIAPGEKIIYPALGT
jgi:hypothetical protein